jgi:flavodoxin
MHMQRSGQTLWRFLLFAGCAAVFFGALSTTPVYSQESSAQKALIAYYSRTGNTRTACEALQKELGCDILEIRDLKSRAGGWGFFTAALGSMFNTHTRIDPEHIDLAPYGAVIIGSPVWAGRPAAAIRTFIAQNSFGDKKVVMFTTTNVFENKGSQSRTENMVVRSGGRVAGYFQVAATEKINEEKTVRSQELIAQDAANLAVEIKKALAQ